MHTANSSKPLKFYIDKLFRETLDHHLQLYKLAEDMEDLCHLMILVVIVFSVILMCFVLYSASVVSIFFNSKLNKYNINKLIVTDIMGPCKNQVVTTIESAVASHLAL